MAETDTQQHQVQVTAEELEAWRTGEALEMATRENFPQIFRDPDSGRYVDFAAITDEDELLRVNDEIEDKYLRKISEKRREFIGEHSTMSQQEAVRQFERELCKLDLYYLTKYVIGAYPDLKFHLHYFMCESIAHPRKGERSLHEFPRDSFKSTCLVIGDNVQLILNNPNIRILIKSNAESNASSKLQETKKAFYIDRPQRQPGTEEYQKFHPHHAGSLSLKELFTEHVPQTKGEIGSGTKYETPAKNIIQSEGTLTAAGVGTTSTSQHFDIIKGDDFWDEKSVRSPETMTKCRDDMQQVEYLLANPAEGQIEYTGTRFAHDDPTTELQNDPGFRCVICSGVTPEGRAIFPENLPLANMYAKFHSQYYNFSCQIMLNPSDDSQGFSSDWFRYMRWDELREAVQNGDLNVQVRILTDAAVDDKSSSDEVAIVPVAFDDQQRKIVLEAIEEKMQPSDFVDKLYQLSEKYRPEFIVRQKTAIETTIMSFINKKQRDRQKEGKFTPGFVDYSLRKVEKKTRITTALQPELQQGTLLFDPDMSGINQMEKEFKEHPNSQQDHVLDALAEMADPVVGRTPKAPKKEPEPDDDPMPDWDMVNGEALFRHQQAAAAFEHARKGQREPVAPGTRVP